MYVIVKHPIWGYFGGFNDGWGTARWTAIVQHAVKYPTEELASREVNRWWRDEPFEFIEPDGPGAIAMHPHTLTNPENQEIARRYYRWVREVQAQLASGVKVRTAWSGEAHTPESFRAELWKAIERRINERGGGLPNGRKWSMDYHWAAWRDSRRIRDHKERRVAIHQFETTEARERLGHLLSSYRD